MPLKSRSNLKRIKHTHFELNDPTIPFTVAGKCMVLIHLQDPGLTLSHEELPTKYLSVRRHLEIDCAPIMTYWIAVDPVNYGEYVPNRPHCRSTTAHHQ